MGRRSRYKRSVHEIKRGTLAPWPADKPPPEEVARRVRYTGSGEHKTHPSAQGLWTLGRRADKAKCGPYAEDRWPLLLDALRAAIRAPCVHQEFRGDFPRRACAYINGTLHEARLTNAGNGEYHGFPLEYEEQFPNDPQGLLKDAPHVAIPVH
jgi:hypothetical protein